MRLTRVLAPAALLMLAVGAWEAAVRLTHLPSYILPPPSAIAVMFALRFPFLASHAAMTLLEIILGILLATAGGVLLAVVIHHSRAAERALYPLIVGSQMVPVFAVAPLLILWFGYGVWPKAAVAALIGFFPVTINAVDGLRSTPRETIDVFRSLGAAQWQVFLKLKLPSSLPLLLSGVKVGATLAVVGATIGEWVGAQRGLGYLMVQSNARLQMEVVFAAILALALLGVAVFAGLRAIERWLLRGRVESSAAEREDGV
jgi:ABC-type nitrate/sulfonate/bicarbonate transport system permease component